MFPKIAGKKKQMDGENNGKPNPMNKWMIWGVPWGTIILGNNQVDPSSWGFGGLDALLQGFPNMPGIIACELRG